MPPAHIDNDRPLLPFAYDPRFLEDYAGRVMSDPAVAVIELVANAYDAGADAVHVSWPSEIGGNFYFSDNGIGMSRTDLEYRWAKWNFNRILELGKLVRFPEHSRYRSTKREPFGRNGKGRFAPFCFDNRHGIRTCDGAMETIADIVIAPYATAAPFGFENTKTRQLKEGELPSGTIILGRVAKNWISVGALKSLVASRFFVDPSFSVFVNHDRVATTDIKGLSSKTVSVGEAGDIIIHTVASDNIDKNTHLHGVSIWVKGRQVGKASWDVLEGEGSYFDGRTAEAKKYSFVVEAKPLTPEDVKPDWSDVWPNAKTNAVKSVAHKEIVDEITRLTAEARRSRKSAALSSSAELLSKLPRVSRAAVGAFVDDILKGCPTISAKDLSATATLFARFEASRSGFELLRQLSECSPDDIDRWNDIVSRWSAMQAKTILEELQRRIDLISRLRTTIERIGADELHEIHPIFDRGLWIFGPEFEAVDFRSNRSMSTVIEQFLGKKRVAVTRRRPDIVATSTASIVPYAQPRFDGGGDVNGYRQILIVELKTTGLQITQTEVDQARDYANELLRNGVAGRDVEIRCYVLGTTLDSLVDKMTIGSVVVIPITYQMVLDRAQRRTFYLQDQIEKLSKDTSATDPEVEQIIASSATLGDGASATE